MAYYGNYYQPQQYFPQITSDVKWVQGESGAKSYLVAPNSEVTLWDSEAKRIYLKSADAYGLPKMRVFEYRAVEEEAPKTPTTGTIDNAEWERLKSDVNSLRTAVETIRKDMRNEHGANDGAVPTV